MAAANAVMETLQHGDHIIASKQVINWQLTLKIVLCCL